MVDENQIIGKRNFTMKGSALLIEKTERGDEYWYSLDKIREKFIVSRVEFQEDTITESFERMASEEDWQDVFVGGSFRNILEPDVKLPSEFLDQFKMKPFRPVAGKEEINGLQG